MTVLIFDIETVPDVLSARKIHNLNSLNDKDVAKALFAMRRDKVGHDFLPLHLQKIVAISLVMANSDQLKVWSLGDKSASEAEIITRFFKGIEKHTPTLVSWNGSGFDLPVLHYRAMLHNVQAPSYWESGENLQSFRWNNYLSRYHYRHLDLMDVIAGYNNRAFAPLEEIATMYGFPGKMGMSGAKVWDEYLAGNIDGIRNYCETDVLNTYCVYLKFQLMRGMLMMDEFDKEIKRLHEYLTQESEKPHLQEFLEHMKS